MHQDLSYATFGLGFLDRLGVRAMADTKTLLSGKLGEAKARANSYARQASEINKTAQKQATAAANPRPVMPKGTQNADVTPTAKRMVPEGSDLVPTGKKIDHGRQVVASKGVGKEQMSIPQQLRRKVALKKAPKGRYHGKSQDSGFARTYNGFSF